MKPLKMAWVVAIAAGSLLGCTNDEMDPEFETLTPNEEETQLHQQQEVSREPAG
ncbi:MULTISPECIES: hypothetical protein [Robiginitalea]|uniref:hypothetical protein n=1 Tax=Robiginitalea TaxID=252306 RepID=UPI002349D28B|nr:MULTISPECIES: hypothetical protein [unclassified Robiginitalea]MDC6355463.1 hypothetical protein [Robiginitalea sp. PM2]MDC6375927.1 hypothetical protein [Robiginitalea sp. SP8]